MGQHPIVTLQVGRATDGRVLLVTASGDSVRLWDAAAGTRLREVDPRAGPLHAVALSPDGRLLAATGLSSRVELWDVAAGKVARELRHPAVAGAVAFAPDGKALATADLDGVLRLWDPATGAERLRCEGHRGIVRQVTFADGGKLLVSCGGDNSIRVWDATTGKSIGQPGHYTSTVTALTASACGPKLVTAHADGSVRLWELPACREVARLRGPSGGAAAVTFSQDGKLLAVEAGAAVCLWEVDTGRERAPAPWHPRGVGTVTFSPDGRTLASAGKAGEICLWDVATQKALREIRARPDMGECLGFVAGGKALLTAGPLSNGMAGLWDMSTGRETRSFRTAPNLDRPSLLSADGSTLLVPEGESTLALWDPATGKVRKRLSADSDCVNGDLALGPDGRTVASVGNNGTLRILAVATDKECLRIQGVAGRRRRARYCPAFSPDGRLVAVASTGASAIELWDTATGVNRWPLTGDENGDDDTIRTLVYSPDGKVLASVGWTDTTIRLREVITGRECGRLRFDGGPAAFAFSPDGQTLATGWPDGTVLLWPVYGLGEDLSAPAGELSEQALQALWEDLAGEDAARAFRAIALLAKAPGRSLSLVAGRLRPQPGPDREQLARAIAELDSARFRTRQEAERQLRKWGEPAEPAVRRALAGRPSEEARRRLEQVLRQLEAGGLTPEQRRQHRAVTLLERAGTPEARRLLEEVARGAEGARLTQEARASLQRLARRAAGTP
jgi:WD40 repeat protein